MAREMTLETWAGNMPPISGEGRKARYDEIVTGVAKMFEHQQGTPTQQWARWTNPPATLKKARQILLERAGELRLNVGGEGLRVAKALDEKGGYVVWIDMKRAAAVASLSKAGPANSNTGQKPTEQPQSPTGASTDPRLQKLAKWLALVEAFQFIDMALWARPMPPAPSNQFRRRTREHAALHVCASRSTDCARFRG